MSRSLLASASAGQSMPPVLKRLSRRPDCCLAVVLAAALSIPAVQAADLPSIMPANVPFQIDAPDSRLEQVNGVTMAIYPRGFVLRQGDWVMIGDAARYDQTHDELYAKGRVVMVIPGVRLQAERLGIHPQTTQVGDAWNVEATIEYQDRRMQVKAKRAHFDRRNVVLEDIELDAGNGAVLGMNAATLHVYLREKPADDRDGIARQVEGIGMTHVRASLMGVPIVYTPYLYRDFTIKYPWTRYEGGASKRQGTFLHSWIGTEFPAVGSWTPGIDVRADANSRNGEAGGVRPYWYSPHGAGELGLYRMPHEQVRNPGNDDEELENRGATVIDFEHRLHAAIDGLGAGAVSARWVSLPPPDLPGSGVWNQFSNPYTNIGPGPDERFRGDFMREDLSERPFAQRGITGTWGNSLGAITLDTQRHPQSGMPTTDRIWGVEAVLPNAKIVGPLFIDGSVWTERLVKNEQDTWATRSSYDGSLGVMQWFGAVGLDAAAGLRGLTYANGTIAGVEQPTDSKRYVPYGTSGVRLRFLGEFANNYINTLTPRVGIQALGKGNGDTLPAFGFGDSRDYLEEDKRYGVTSLATDLTRAGAALFTGQVTARWALRDQERAYIDDQGVEQTSPHRLVDVSIYASGSPAPDLTLTGQAVYQALYGRWDSLDAMTSYSGISHVRLRYGGTLLPADPTRGGPTWQHRPGASLLANRYRYDVDFMFQPSGATVDQTHVQITRKMLEGELYLFSDVLYDDNGTLYDQRIGIGFGMVTGGSNDDPNSQPSRGRGGSYRLGSQ